MPITVRWYEDMKTIILYQYEGIYTQEDINQANQEMNELLKEVDHKVALIMDIRNRRATPVADNATSLPAANVDIREMRPLSFSLVQFPSQIGFTAVLLPDSSWNSMNTILQVIGDSKSKLAQFSYVTSMEEAHNKITEYLSKQSGNQE